jgi:hypothetical protein
VSNHSVIRSRLESLHRNTLIKFTRPFEQGSISGYVFDIGPEFFLLALVGDRIQFDGFLCIRLKDVRGLQIPANYSSFINAALRKRGERLPRKPRVSLRSLPELLTTSNRLFPLITIQRERVNSGVCNIGRVVEVNHKRVSLLEIGPDACWDETPTSYAVREITQIGFGGAYEEALLLVGGLSE